MKLKSLANTVIQKQEKKGIKHLRCPRRESCTDIKTYIASPKVKSNLDFLAYLHELGHCKSKQPDFYIAITGNPVSYCSERHALVTKWNKARLQCEFNAWVWAIKYYKRIGGVLRQPQKEMIIGYFGNYLYDAEDKQTADIFARKMYNMFGIKQTSDKFYQGY